MSIDETTQTMFGMGRLNPMTLLQLLREAKSILDAFQAKKKQSAGSNDYHFTGQHTDIAFVAENGRLNAGEIERIPDEQLRNNVTVSFSDAVKDGYLDFDNHTRDFTLTQKGLAHINSEAFLKQFEKDQLGQITENKAEVLLKGDASDLNVFRFTDSINLNQLENIYPADFARVRDYFRECEKYGFVNISSDGIVTPTERCLTYLEQTPMKDFEIRKITPDNLDDVVDRIVEQKIDNFYDYELNGKINSELKESGAVGYKNITAEQAEYLRSVKDSENLKFAIFDAAPDTNNQGKLGGYNIVFAKSDSEKFTKILNDFERKPTQKKQQQIKPTAEAATSSAEKVLGKVESGVTAAKDAVSFVSGESSGEEVAAKGAKTAAEQGAKKLGESAAKKAQEAAAKKATQKAAQKAAAKATAKASAKAAASSTGYGAAIVAAIELTVQGANKLTKMDTQSHKVTVTRK